MTSGLRKLSIFAIIPVLAACGVKSKPLPPDHPPVIGKGFPAAQELAEKPAEEGLTKKRKANLPEDDFKEPSDFGPESE